MTLTGLTGWQTGNWRNPACTALEPPSPRPRPAPCHAGTFLQVPAPLVLPLPLTGLPRPSLFSARKGRLISSATLSSPVSVLPLRSGKSSPEHTRLYISPQKDYSKRGITTPPSRDKGTNHPASVCHRYAALPPVLAFGAPSLEPSSDLFGRPTPFTLFSSLEKLSLSLSAPLLGAQIAFSTDENRLNPSTDRLFLSSPSDSRRPSCPPRHRHGIRLQMDSELLHARNPHRHHPRRSLPASERTQPWWKHR